MLIITPDMQQVNSAAWSTNVWPLQTHIPVGAEQCRSRKGKLVVGEGMCAVEQRGVSARIFSCRRRECEDAELHTSGFKQHTPCKRTRTEAEQCTILTPELTVHALKLIISSCFMLQINLFSLLKSSSDVITEQSEKSAMHLLPSCVQPVEQHLRLLLQVNCNVMTFISSECLTTRTPWVSLSI